MNWNWWFELYTINDDNKAPSCMFFIVSYLINKLNEPIRSKLELKVLRLDVYSKTCVTGFGAFVQKFINYKCCP